MHPSICRTKDGTLVVVYKGANVLMVTRSKDNGATWEIGRDRHLGQATRRDPRSKNLLGLSRHCRHASGRSDCRHVELHRRRQEDDGDDERALLYTVSADQGRTWTEQGLIGPVNDKHLGAVRHDVLPWSARPRLLPLRGLPPTAFDPKLREVSLYPLVGPDGKQHAYQQIMAHRQRFLAGDGACLLAINRRGNDMAVDREFLGRARWRQRRGTVSDRIEQRRAAVTGALEPRTRACVTTTRPTTASRGTLDVRSRYCPSSTLLRDYSARTIELDPQHVGTVFMNSSGVHFLKGPARRLVN